MGSAYAQPAKGKYYRFLNQKYNKVMKENWSSQDVTCNTVDNDDYTQVWMYTSTGALQNVYTGRYIQDQSGTSATFKTGATAQSVSFTKLSDGHYYLQTNSHALHCDAAQNVVCWNDQGNEANHWTVKEVALTADEVKAIREEFTYLSGLRENGALYTEKLSTFFTNELCTELKAEYASMSDADLRAAMAAAELPTSLQDIAVKIKNNWWNDTENSAYADKNQYAKEFRIASYKPYSDANNWRDKLNTYAPSFMGNPTGIYATNKDVIHVFVGSDIPEGATLYLSPVRNHGRIGSRREGTELKKGYNAVIATNDSLTYFVNYVVNTVPAEGANAHTKPIAKISDFPELDIHIEGGECIGYYQKPAENSAEEDAKFQYLSQNAKNNMYFVVKGETSLFYFKKQTFTSVWPKTIWNSINWFDRVHFWEFGLIGILDDVANGKLENGTEFSKSAHPFNITGGDAFYPTYCNNPTMAIEGADGTNPHATTFYTSYPGTWGVESSFNAERANFDTWCTGHEHGHQIQAPYNLESCTESSVNLPSQLVTYMTGFRLGRGWSFGQHYNTYVGKGVPFGLRDISITMRMYWNMFLYYHVAGKKKDFYPTFVKSLREDPMSFAADNWIDGVNHHRATKTWLHLYKKACEAAKEDLTEYFRLWGFFEPCNKLMFGDYTNYYVSLTQKEIDAAIAEVKAKGYPENLQIMFVEDRQLMRERTDIWAHTATGNKKNRPTNWEEWYTQDQLKAEYGDVGDVLTYIDGSANTSEYTYIQSGNKITLKGKGGVGFIVYDEAGNNKYMSNYLEFEIPADLASQKFVIKAINADGSSTVVTDAADSATDAEKLAILKTAIEASKEFTNLEDKTAMRVGFYSTESLATLKAYVADANEAISAGNVSVYLTLADNINAEMLRLQTDNEMIQLNQYTLYNIQCVRRANDGSTRYLQPSGNSLQTTTGTTAASTRWAFVHDGVEGSNNYYIQNRSNNKMMGILYNDGGKIENCKMVEADRDQACTFNVKAMGNGIFCLRPNDATNLNMHNQGYVTVWGDADEGSQWYINGYDTFEELTDDDMNQLITMTEDLVNDVCVYEELQTKYPLQCTDAEAANYISTNQADETKPGNQIDKAIDGVTSTYFISKKNSSLNEAHHLMVDLGGDKKSKSLQFYLFGNSLQNYATEINVYASSNKKSWSKVTTVSLPKVSSTSDVIKPSTAYRYWRFDVVKTTGRIADNSTYPWFTVKEFELFEYEVVITKKAPFDAVENINNTVITNCKTRIGDLEKQMQAAWRTPLADFVAWNSLNTAYNTLYKRAAEVDPTVGVENLEADAEGNADASIYDLSGRKLNNAGNKGVYIINGKKVIK